MTSEHLSTKKLMLINSSPPYGTSNARESLDLALMASAFLSKISIVFLDDGVFQLKQQQDPAAIRLKNFSAAFKAFTLYDIDPVYVEHESLLARNLNSEDLLIPVVVINTIELRTLIAEHDVIMNF